MSGMELSKHDHTLLAIVSQYQTMAMVSLGKVQNPMTGKLERDLEQAHLFIDVLEMLKVKCRTGTPEEILRMLDAAVMDLQLNFLDEKKKSSEANESSEASESSEVSESEEEAGTGEAIATEAADTQTDEAEGGVES